MPSVEDDGKPGTEPFNNEPSNSSEIVAERLLSQPEQGQQASADVDFEAEDGNAVAEEGSVAMPTAALATSGQEDKPIPLPGLAEKLDHDDNPSDRLQAIEEHHPLAETSANHAGSGSLATLEESRQSDSTARGLHEDAEPSAPATHGTTLKAPEHRSSHASSISNEEGTPSNPTIIYGGQESQITGETSY